MANGTSAPCSCARLAPENSIRAKEDSIKAKIVAKLAGRNPVSANPSPCVRQTIGRVSGLLLNANLRIQITDHYLSDPRSCQTSRANPTRLMLTTSTQVPFTLRCKSQKIITCFCGESYLIFFRLSLHEPR